MKKVALQLVIVAVSFIWGKTLQAQTYYFPDIFTPTIPTEILQ
jgi:hypothetical protein